MLSEIMPSNSEEYNEDELEAPGWLDKEFLTKILRECESDSKLTVKNFKITPGTVKGDHYASIMFRALVDYVQCEETRQKSLIIKTMPEADGNKKELLAESKVFRTEIDMYREVIPKFEAVLREAGDDTRFAPKCLYCSLSPRQLIVFEDLCPFGYTVLREKLDLENTKEVLLKLAKWHAIGHKLSSENPAIFAKYRNGSMIMSNFAEVDFLTGGIKLFGDLLSTEPSLEEYKPYFEGIRDTLIEKSQNSFREFHEHPQENQPYSMVHGDFHHKNLMFRLNASSNKCEDVLFLDYQFSFMGPLVIDVINALFLVMKNEIRFEKRDEMLYFFFSNYIETLKKIRFDGRLPKLVEFREQMMRHKEFELFTYVTFLPMFYSFEDGLMDVEQILQCDDFRKKMYRSKAYLADLHKCLPRYLHLGYFGNI